MSEASNSIDRFAVALAKFTIRRRWYVILASLITVILVASGARFLDFATNYRVFFSSENPELIAFETFQNTYTKNDNFLIVVQPKDGRVFSQDVTAAIEAATEEAWQIPYAIRVDSITNFQHTWSEEDDLIVEDLVENGAGLSDDALARRKTIALVEPLLRDNLIARNAQTTGINVILQYPEESIHEVPMAVEKAREIVATIETSNPDLTVALSGISMLNNTFAESGQRDIMTLVPLMYGVLLIVMLFALRTVTGTFATLMVILLSCVTAMGAAGYGGVLLTPVSLTAPTIILTLAIADSVHILVSLREAMRDGMDKQAAIIEAMRINFLAVTITSITTIIGFMALNFSDAPPFQHLGNMTAVGIAAAWALSTTFLPALVAVLPMRVKATPNSGGRRQFMVRIADFVIARYRAVILVMGLSAIGLTALVPTIDLDDAWTKYFDRSIEFRRDTDFAIEHLAGLYPVEFSVPAADSGGVSEPEFLAHLETFTNWLREQPGVTHVYSLTDIMKRLNKNMHGDDPDYYRLPSDRELSAQYLLLYELSLPFGLDLNDRINIDKSATRVTATMGDVSTVEVRKLIERSEAWMRENTPEYMHTRPTGATVMFSFIAKRNIESMLRGNAIAVALIAIIMILALRSLSLGTLSLIPNAIPILMTFGVWAALVGVVGLAAATVSATSLGIIVDNTVHLLTKYQRGLREQGLSVPDAIRYAFRTVGNAVAINALILAFGFGVLALSTFKINAEMGILTAMAVVIALIVDFLLLPALLMLASQFKKESTNENAEYAAAG